MGHSEDSIRCAFCIVCVCQVQMKWEIISDGTALVSDWLHDVLNSAIAFQPHNPQSHIAPNVVAVTESKQWCGIRCSALPRGKVTLGDQKLDFAQGFAGTECDCGSWRDCGIWREEAVSHLKTIFGTRQVWHALEMLVSLSCFRVRFSCAVRNFSKGHSLLRGQKSCSNLR